MPRDWDRSINSLPIDAFRDMLPNHTESSSEENPTHRNNFVYLNMVYVDGPDSTKNAGSVASKPHILGSRRIRLTEKTHRQSMLKDRKLCGDGEGHRVTAAIIVVRSRWVIGLSRVICIVIGYI